MICNVAMWGMVLLESSMAMLEELAASMEAKELDEAQAQGVLLGIDALLEASGEMLAQPVPDLKFGAAWSGAQEAHRLVQPVLTEWTEAKIQPAEVPTRLQAAKPSLNDALAQAEQTMAQEYGITSEQLKQWREETVAQQATLRLLLGSTPAPKP